MFICGDIVNYEHKSGRVCSDEFIEVINSSDYAVHNFEAPVGGYKKTIPKSGSHHCQRKETILGLKQQGFETLMLAKNQIMDFSVEGLVTLDFGVIDHFECSNSAGYAWINRRNIDISILQLKNKCDFVIVYSHAGIEHYHIPQKKWFERYKHFYDLGADIVVDSHPQLPQGYETHNGLLIFYNLGNFYFDSKNDKNKEDQFFAVWLELKKGKDPSFKPIYHYKKDGLVNLVPHDKCISLESMFSILGENYMKQHDRMSLEVYIKIKRDLTLSMMSVLFDGSLVSLLRRIVSKLLDRSKKVGKQLFQLHLLRNEAYYFSSKNALKVKTKERYSV